MKKNDYILIALILIVTIGAYIGIHLFAGEGSQVQVQVDGELYGTYDLSEDQTIQINDTNVLRILDGEVFMESATCPDELCIHQGLIDKDGESIICLPNKVVVSIHSDEENEYDAISK